MGEGRSFGVTGQPLVCGGDAPSERHLVGSGGNVREGAGGMRALLLGGPLASHSVEVKSVTILFLVPFSAGLGNCPTTTFSEKRHCCRHFKRTAMSFWEEQRILIYKNG